MCEEGRCSGWPPESAKSTVENILEKGFTASCLIFTLYYLEFSATKLIPEFIE